MYNAGLVSQEPFHAPVFRDQSHPSVLMPVNGQPIPVRRDPSPNRASYAQGPRSAPWSSVVPPTGRSATSDGIIDPSHRDTRTGIHLPGNYPNQQPTGYPVQPFIPPPQRFPVVPNDRTAYPNPSIQNLPMQARPQNYPTEHKVPRRKVQGPVPMAAAAARSAYPPRSTSPPNKLRKGYPGLAST
jgi:hypothetical protein